MRRIYTIVFDSETMKGVHYSFDSIDQQAAIEWAKWKIGGKPMKLIQNDDSSNSDNGIVVYNDYDR